MESEWPRGRPFSHLLATFPLVASYIVARYIVARYIVARYKVRLPYPR